MIHTLYVCNSGMEVKMKLVCSIKHTCNMQRNLPKVLPWHQNVKVEYFWPRENFILGFSYSDLLISTLKELVTYMYVDWS